MSVRSNDISMNRLSFKKVGTNFMPLEATHACPFKLLSTKTNMAAERTSETGDRLTSCYTLKPTLFRKLYLVSHIICTELQGLRIFTYSLCLVESLCFIPPNVSESHESICECQRCAVSLLEKLAKFFVTQRSSHLSTRHSSL